MVMLDITSSAGGIVSLFLYFALAWAFTRILCDIARHNARQVAANALTQDTSQLELTEEEEEETTTSKNGDYVQAGRHLENEPAEHNDETITTTPPPDHQEQTLSKLTSPGKLSREDKIGITVRVWILMLLNYLLLVFLPGGSVVLSFAATASVWGLTLHPYVYEELWRRRRWDRVMTLVALFVWIAAAATALTYHRLTWQTGTVYAGSARIVGYDTSVYENADEETVRADLEVAWGGTWACGSEYVQCQTTVAGALCQAKYNASDFEDDGRRYLAHTITVADDDKVAAKEEEFEEEVVEEADEEVVEYEEEVVEEADEEIVDYEDALDEAYTVAEEEDEEEVEEIEEEEAEVEEEKEELIEENNELEEELEEEEDYADELEEEIEYDYDYEDDYYESDYWAQYDWNSVWGEYACEDLFDADLEGLGYDETIPAGTDDWPTVEIYGSCRSCEAFLMDYYSTEHFLTIQAYLVQAYAYGLLGTFLMGVAAVCAYRERLRPSQDTQIVLLSEDGGVMA